jgi:UDP-2-acetamido-3-amino-2,3-dideoxy-glucuronate N-acetyltransferase
MVNIGVIGSGYWGKNLVRVFSGLDALHTICDVDPNVLESLRAQYPRVHTTSNYLEVLNSSEINGVAIATPAVFHFSLVRGALLAGKDVFVEKPLSLSVEEGRQLVALAKEKQRILMVGHILWYHPAVLKVRELIDAGELGRIQYIYSNRLNLGKIRREENILWSFAPHDLSVILGLLGEMPDEVLAQGGNYLHQQIADITVSLLSFPSGVKAHIFVSWLHPYKEQKLIVIGDRKMVVFDDVEKKEKLLVYPHTINWKNQIPVVNKAQGQPVEFKDEEPLQAECRHFLECIRTRQRPKTDGEEGLRVLTVLKQCQKALESDVRKKPTSTGNSMRPYFAHESAFIDEEVEIGVGTAIWHMSHILRLSKIGENCKIGQNVVIGPKVTIGNGVKIQNNVSVYEGVTLEDHVFCGPSMVFTNVSNPRSEIPRMHEVKPTLVKQGATLGANATIVCGVTIGQYAFIGAGAVITKNVPDFALVVGNPGRITGWVCKCGLRLKEDNDETVCVHCGRRYRKENNSMQIHSENKDLQVRT